MRVSSIKAPVAGGPGVVWHRRLRSVLLRALPDGLHVRLKVLHSRRLLRRVSEEREPDLRLLPFLVAPGDCVVDVGANIGVYTQALARHVGTAGRVYALEPVPLTFRVLEANVAALGLDAVRPLCCAASAAHGTLHLEVPHSAEGAEDFYCARVTPHAQAHAGLRTVHVPCAPLDALLAHEPRVTFLKVDVEGHEAACLAGARRLLREHRPALLLEVSGEPDVPGSSAHGLLAQLRAEGYDAYWLQAGRLRRRAPGERSVNFFFLTPAHLTQLAARGWPSDALPAATSCVA